MSSPIPKRQPKSPKQKPATSRFAPAAFLSASPEVVQKLCEELAKEAAARFAARTATSWKTIGTSLAQHLRAVGHDLGSFDDSDELQEWQATWYQPKGTFSLFLSFRASGRVEVTWTADDAKFVARA